MRPRGSLRSKLLVGSILWTVGLLFVSHVAAVRLVHWYFDGAPRIVMTHTTFRVTGIVLVAAALLLMAAGFRQVRRGLSNLDRLRDRLGALRDGRERRLEGDYPSEIQPLVVDLNELLDHREAAVRRALAKAGDLAHGLKTPLAVLAQEAARASQAGDRELAATLSQQVERMRRQVDYHLAQARAVGAGANLGAHSPVRGAAEALARTLSRLHAERGLAIRVEAAPGLGVRVEPADFDELLGNLLDNACKWARREVVVAATAGAGSVVLTVDDDGPGLARELREEVLQRGVRADEAAPGSGLGLAIVRDLAELYGGSIALAESPAGGLRARLVLPAG
ncbi:MAG: ATP-binding protein [Thermoanaerobaculia bacterium]|nr:ATP-binding protein [Thermoanaerobaculia bacterium]